MPTSTSDVALWYARYAASVRGAVVRVTGDADADDALHDAFLAAWRARDAFDAARDPLPWLLAIARRKALTIAGRRRRPFPPLGPPATVPSAEDEALAREAEAAVRRLIAPEPALALRALDDLPLRDVGRRLGVPQRTAASRINRGKLRLRAALPATPHFFRESRATWSTSS
jgi:RNA polymerase sigma-70 factor, ECF subfamily